MTCARAPTASGLLPTRRHKRNVTLLCFRRGAEGNCQSRSTRGESGTIAGINGSGVAFNTKMLALHYAVNEIEHSFGPNLFRQHFGEPPAIGQSANRCLDKLPLLRCPGGLSEVNRCER